MKIDRDIKVQIGTSLIATFIFIYLFKPIFSITSKTFFIVFDKINISAINHIYRAAALSETTDYSYLLFSLIISGGLGLVSGFFTYPKLSHLIEGKEWKGINDEARARKLKRGIKFVKKIVTMIILIFGLYGLFLLWEGAFIARTITSFKQHMAIIAPYLPETEKIEILSKWAQMNDKTAYEEIYKKINNIASEHNLKLPKNPIY